MTALEQLVAEWRKEIEQSSGPVRGTLIYCADALQAAIASERGGEALSPLRSEVRRNEDGSLDEVVGFGSFHLEQMDDDHWWLQLGPHIVSFVANDWIRADLSENEAKDANAAYAKWYPPPPAQAADRLSAELTDDLERALMKLSRLDSLYAKEAAHFINAALRRLAAPVADGFVMVPREPTEAMVNAFHAGGGLHGYSTAVLGGLRSAIAIAATPPAGDAAT